MSVQNPEPETTKESSGDPPASSRIFSRDVNYVRDVVLAWPFIIFSIIAVASLLSPNSRQIGLKCAISAGVAILLAKERLLMFLGALGFCAIQVGLC